MKYLSLMIVSLIILFFGLIITNTQRQIVPATNYRYNASLSTDINKAMIKPPKILLQYLVPQHGLTRLCGWLGENRQPWLKNYLINRFINKVGVDMNLAVISDPKAYPTFNAFFIRQLKPELRPIAQEATAIVSPVDGFVSQIGRIQEGTLIQAKNHDYTLKNLLGGSDKHVQAFLDGSFATLYLSPKDYHRVHMPYRGKLRETIYIPGDLFSVNQQTTSHVPGLFARNERLVCLFDTDIGPMAVIMVGAMLVGSIHTVWHAVNNASKPLIESFGGSLILERGQEMGHFQMGSTVILLFGKDKMKWVDHLKENAVVRMGQLIAQK